MGKYEAGLSPDAVYGAGWNPAPRDTRVDTRVWVAGPHGASAVDGANLGDKELMDEGIVRVERRISSSSEVSPPKPAYH